jgi:putative spermidine/putrescine transport system ATP-binding protein
VKLRSPVPSKGAEVRYQAIEKHYASTHALRPTTLDIRSGEFFSIIGPSGSGKSTLLGVTVGFISPTGGKILVDGIDVVGIPPYRRNIGMVFQSYSLFPHMTAAGNIGFPLRMRKVPESEIRTRVDRVLSMVRLEGMGERQPAQLSGGQRQRVALARAAVYDPVLLLMDEPLSALDKNLREEMQNEIKQLQRQLGTTVLYVTHDQNEATYMSDRIAIMSNGTVEQVGTPVELYEKPRNKFIASFLGEANMFEIAAIDGHSGTAVTVRTVEGFRIRSTAAVPEGKGLFACIRPEHITLERATSAADNCLEGKITDVMFSSGNLIYRIQLLGGATITQKIPNIDGRFKPERGETVALSWSADRTLLVGD